MSITTFSSLGTAIATGLQVQQGLGKKAVSCAAALLILVLFSRANACAADPLFVALQARLIADGLDAHFIQKLYQHPLIKLEPEIVAKNLKRSESVLNYDQFLAPYAVAKAERYLRRYRRALERAERRFGVPPPIVVAILMVETALGDYTGKYPALNVLSTMAVADDARVRSKIFQALSPEDRKMQSEGLMSQRLEKRVARSYKELKALIHYVRNNSPDPFTLRGSSEGAIGIPQFLPSNIGRYGRDGDGDGIVDLFRHEDAIASVASFLEAHKWRRARGVKAKKRVLFHYNHSVYYVDTVYALAERLQGKGSVTGP